MLNSKFLKKVLIAIALATSYYPLATGAAQAQAVLGDSTLTFGMAEDFIFLFVKLMFLLAILIYGVFALVIVRQVHVMKNTLITSFSPIVIAAAYLHLFLALGVAVLFWGIL